MRSQISKQALRRLVRELGARAFGVADLGPLKARYPGLLDSIGADFSRAVVMGLRLQDAVLDAIVDRPTPLYFHHYRQVNYDLDTLALRVADLLQEAGFRALAVPASQIIGRDPMRGHVSHRLMGHAAGIGYRGRSSLLIHPEYGARMRYVTVLTDADLEADEPAKGDCGSCRACVAACPAGAIHERGEEFDAEACYRKLTEFTHLPFIGQHICGICVKACGGKARGMGDGEEKLET